MESTDIDAWMRAGLYDPTAVGADDRLALLRMLADDGCSLSDTTAADARGRLFGLAGDRRIWPGTGVHAVAQAGALAGLGSKIRTAGSALALYLPLGDAPALTSADVEALRTYRDLRAMVGQDAALGILRVIGARDRPCRRSSRGDHAHPGLRDCRVPIRKRGTDGPGVGVVPRGAVESPDVLRGRHLHRPV